MRISRRLQQLKPSATLAVTARAMALRAQGREIVSLSVGEPDFPTPEPMVTAAKAAIDAGFTRYTQVQGIPELREAVAGYFRRYYGVSAPLEATMVSNGGKQVLYNLLQALVDPGDEVVIPAPYWVSYPPMVELAGGVARIVPTRIENDFKLTVPELEQALTPNTRVLILNSPSNPTGVQYAAAELNELADFAISRQIFIISDEIYDQLVFPPAEPASLAARWEKTPEYVAIVNGLAKSYAATGWRVGYALAHPELIKAMSRLQGQSTSNICSIAQKGALGALTGSDAHLAIMRQTYERRRDLVLDILSRWPGVVCPRPQGAFYVFPKLDAYYSSATPDSTSLCTRLLEEAGVALVPGVEFGDDRCVRISYATSEDRIIRGLDQIGKVLLG